MNSVPQLIRRRRDRQRRARPGLILIGGLGAAGMALLLVLVGVIGLVGVTGALYFRIASVIPADPRALSAPGSSEQPTLLLDREGQRILYRVENPAESEGAWLALADLPTAAWQATVAIEDGSYFQRPGFSLGGLAAALQDAFFYGEMRLNDPILLALVRQVILPTYAMPLDHPDRVHTEAIVIMELRRRFSREELLEWYLNTALYGNGAYGLESAARYYLGKSATALTLAEAALLAGVPGNPSRNPFDQPEAAHAQQQVVLSAMSAFAMIGPEEAAAAGGRLAVTRALAPNDVVAPHYALAARRQAEQILNEAGLDGARLVAGGGLRITTALDLDLHYQAECLLRTQVIRLGGVDPNFVYSTAIGEPCRAAEYLPDMQPADIGVQHSVTNGAVMVLAPETGQVLAYVGSIDYWNEAIGGPLDSVARPYEPGSMIRPYVYLTALSQGYTAATMTLDVPLTLESSLGQMLQVANPSGQYRGPMSLRRAFVLDAVPPAAQMMNLVSAGSVIRTAHSMGLNTLTESPAAYDVTLAVEGGTAALSDLTFSFGVLANGGRMVGLRIPAEFEQPGLRTLDPVLVLQIEAEDGTQLWSYTPQQRDALDPALAYLMNAMLGDRELRVQEFGPNNAYDIGRPAAVFGGQSADASALWTIGYTPQIAVGVWLGNATGESTARLDARNGPAPIWNAALRYLLARDGMALADWSRPASVVEQAVCAVSGLLPSQYCPVVTEIFAQGTQPTRADTFYQMVEVNRQNGRRATASTPRDQVEQRVYFAYPAEAQEWAMAQGITSPPAEYDALGPPQALGPVAILEPEVLAYVRGVVEVRGNATLPGFRYFQVAYGAGLNPTNWTQVGDQIATPARGGLLGRWDTTGLEGLYSLRLTVVTDTQEVQQSVIQVTVDNTPPVVSMAAPLADSEVIVEGMNPSLDLAATVSDNVGIAQVIYYLDGESVATGSAPPFGAALVLEGTGPHSLWAEAFDMAGNSALSERITFTVRRSTP